MRVYWILYQNSRFWKFYPMYFRCMLILSQHYQPSKDIKLGFGISCKRVTRKFEPFRPRQGEGREKRRSSGTLRTFWPNLVFCRQVEASSKGTRKRPKPAGSLPRTTKQIQGKPKRQQDLFARLEEGVSRAHTVLVR